jgi:tRNA dimethylallyltransferase
MNKKIIFITGPTASGKSSAAMILAERIGAEIISCDSMQVYKGMDIITSKPSASDRARVPHHLLDIVPPTEEYNAFRYYEEAAGKVEDIFIRGKIPLFVGGTGLYVSAALDGLFACAPERSSLREEFYRQASSAEGAAALHARLSEHDPAAGKRIHPNDVRRIVRALEVWDSTGKPISDKQKERKGLSELYATEIFCLNPEREELYRRIEERVDEMFASGLEKEARGLLEMPLSRTAAFAIGLKELKEYFEGRCALDEARRLMKLNTRHYAKRQMTWFRKDKRVRWINQPAARPEEAAEIIWKELLR